MWFKMVQLNLAYKAAFAEPVFDLVTVPGRVFKSFYKTLNPKFSMGMSDLQSVGGASYADVSYKINLFGGSGTLTITAEGLQAIFQGLRTPEDIKTVTDCIILSDQALREAFPGTSIKSRQYTALTWLECEGGSESVRQLLHNRGNQVVPLAEGDLGAEKVSYSLGADFTNDAEGWGGRIALERSLLDQADLYYRMESAYIDTGKYATLESQIQHTQDVYLEMLHRFGLEPFEAETEQPG